MQPAIARLISVADGERSSQHVRNRLACSRTREQAAKSADEVRASALITHRGARRYFLRPRHLKMRFLIAPPLATLKATIIVGRVRSEAAVSSRSLHIDALALALSSLNIVIFVVVAAAAAAASKRTRLAAPAAIEDKRRPIARAQRRRGLADNDDGGGGGGDGGGDERRKREKLATTMAAGDIQVADNNASERSRARVDAQKLAARVACVFEQNAMTRKRGSKSDDLQNVFGGHLAG